MPYTDFQQLDLDSRKYNATHIANTNNYQIQETCWYEVTIGGTREDMTFLVQSATLPEANNPVIDVGFGNSIGKIAGRREYGEGTFQFMDAMRRDMELQLLEWQQKVYDPTDGKMGWVQDYKRDIYVTQYGPDGSFERKWVLEGCWPTSINYGEMTSESADKKVISVTVAYDNAYRKAAEKTDIKKDTKWHT